MAQREILGGTVLDVHQRAFDDPEATLPETTLSPSAERNIESAANLLLAGAYPKKVLRTLYCLALLEGLSDMAKVRP